MEACFRALKAAQFHKVGGWRLKDGARHFTCAAPEEAGVYAFVVDNKLHYVGAAQRGLGKRLRNYNRKQERFRVKPDRRPVHKWLNAAIDAGREVDIWVVAPDSLRWRDLPVNLVAGIEEGIIKHFHPPWNVRGRIAPSRA